MLTDEQIRRFEQDILHWYPIAKDSVLFYETEEGERATSAIVELRDVLDHFHLASSCGDSARAERLLGDVLDHLRTVAVEPIEHAAEDRLARYVKRAVRTLTRIPPPPMQRLRVHEAEVKRLIREGRKLKPDIETAQEAVGRFKQAHQKVGDLEKLLENDKTEERQFQLVLALIAIVGVVIVALLTT